MELTKENLIQGLIDGGYLKTPLVIDAFQNVDRKDFMLPEYREFAYLDEAMPIGYGQTISQPLTVAFMLELLCGDPSTSLRAGKILDVGSGSGWTTALLAQIAGEKGRVFGVEKIPELVEFGRRNLAKYKFKNAEILPAGQELGLPKEALPALSRVARSIRLRATLNRVEWVEGFDKILVSAAAHELPQELVNQLKVGGRMVIPILNSIWKIDKVSKKEIKKEEYFGFSFVPLIKK